MSSSKSKIKQRYTFRNFKYSQLQESQQNKIFLFFLLIWFTNENWVTKWLCEFFHKLRLCVLDCWRRVCPRGGILVSQSNQTDVLTQGCARVHNGIHPYNAGYKCHSWCSLVPNTCPHPTGVINPARTRPTDLSVTVSLPVASCRCQGQQIIPGVTGRWF